MARFVVVSFDNNSEAEGFIEAFKRGESAFFYEVPLTESDLETGSDGTGEQDYSGGVKYQNFSGKGQVVGMYMRPTQFCNCRTEGKWQKQDGFSQGKNYGLWVHNRCGKPVAMAHEDTALHARLTGFGYNLALPEEDRRRVHGAAVKEYYGHR